MREGRTEIALERTVQCTDQASTREEVGDWLRRLGASPQHVGDAQLVFAELVSNGCTHGSSSQVQVQLRVDGTNLVITAVNQTSASANIPSDTEMPPVTAVTGRGLAIVAALCSQVDVENEPGALRVQARLDGVLDSSS